MIQYVIQDRVTANRWALKIADGEPFYEDVSDTASPEPIFQDTVNSSDHWRLFISDGQLAIEPTVTIQNDQIDLMDSVNGQTYRIAVSNGEINYITILADQFVVLENIGVSDPITMLVGVE